MKKYVFTFVISFFLIMFGSILTVKEVLNFNISDSFKDETLTKKTVTYNLKTTTTINTEASNDPTIAYDNNITAGNVKVTVTYYDELITVDQFKDEDSSEDITYITMNEVSDYSAVKRLLNLTLEGLKNKEVYNYQKAFLPDVKIYINETDKDIIKIRK